MVLGFEKLNVPGAVVVQVVFVRRMIDVCQMISMGQFKRAQCNSGHDLFICSPSGVPRRTADKEVMPQQKSDDGAAATCHKVHSLEGGGCALSLMRLTGSRMLKEAPCHVGGCAKAVRHR